MYFLFKYAKMTILCKQTWSMFVLNILNVEGLALISVAILATILNFSKHSMMQNKHHSEYFIAKHRLKYHGLINKTTLYKTPNTLIDKIIFRTNFIWQMDRTIHNLYSEQLNVFGYNWALSTV